VPRAPYSGSIMRLLRPVIGAAAILTLLSGCFLLPTAAERPSAGESAAAGDAVPQVGDCWSGEYTSYTTWVAWHGDGPVDCAERHQSYTYAMSDAFEDADATYAFGGWHLDDAAPIAYDSCRELLTDYLGVELNDWARLEIHFFGPSAQEWRKGARWLRCDLAVIKAGSNLYEPELQSLPDDAADLVTNVEKNADHYDFCIDTYDGWYELGPYYSADAFYANCANDPMWRLIEVDFMPWEYGDAYPGNDYVLQFAKDTCFGGGPAVAPFAADFPDEDRWKEGYVSVSCWLYEWELPEAEVAPV
jgi:hypothetical protein